MTEYDRALDSKTGTASSSGHDSKTLRPGTILLCQFQFPILSRQWFYIKVVNTLVDIAWFPGMRETRCSWSELCQVVKDHQLERLGRTKDGIAVYRKFKQEVILRDYKSVEDYIMCLVFDCERERDGTGMYSPGTALVHCWEIFIQELLLMSFEFL